MDDALVPEFADAGLFDAKMVRDFVHHRATDLLAQRCQRVSRAQQWPAIEGDAVRSDQVIVPAALCEWDAFVQTKELMGMLDASAQQFAGTGPIGDRDGDVVEVLPDLLWQLSQRTLNQRCELCLSYVTHLALFAH